MKIGAVVVLLGAVCGFAGAAEISHIPSDFGHKTVFLNGAIRSGDLQKLQTTYGRIKGVPNEDSGPMGKKILLNSPGGDVLEAMAIGRWIRKNGMSVWIPENSQCYSSCMYLLAAGLVKMNFGEVGIHRPYFLSKPSSGFETSMRKILSDSQAYFMEMNIPAQLADDMFSIPPERIKLLSPPELARYRLDQDDLAYGEERDIRNSQSYGMTRQEYMRKWAAYQEDSKKCVGAGSNDKLMACLNKYLVKYGFRLEGID